MPRSLKDVVRNHARGAKNAFKSYSVVCQSNPQRFQYGLCLPAFARDIGVSMTFLSLTDGVQKVKGH